MRCGPRAELNLALAVPRWAWRFCLRYLPVIGGLSLLPALQRFVVVNWGSTSRPGWPPAPRCSCWRCASCCWW
ncbi:hypothetical protein [Amycolatopsis cihanbeyliensis]|uniref:hypothetical protein n=1 Tax=Amycolatopsis cihanbeyliensis TaxID=1128664 RepID=UPI001FE7B30D|nr:hypothetical protein [Amycolatopsis cihanbeyliensis]